ncbi:hypothetical protein LTR64_001428 [Lithohypha guttulata]|uniref:uncharacterized protein n=1 Tax=Lithohypha guttulata TaxID=1690604 RepID=UPI002DDFB794|nr:hypothetical protein LTR51_003622 [Lithohypha guttulata]
MFAVRRYRLLLLVAISLAISVYYLTTRASWETTDAERVGRVHLKNDPTAERPVVNNPLVVPQRPPPDQEAADSPATTSETRVISSPSTSTDLDSSTTYSTKLAEPTITSEELLFKDESSTSGLDDENTGRYEVDEDSDDDEKIHWQKPIIHFPFPEDEIIGLPSGSARKLPRVQAVLQEETSAARKDRLRKLSVIKGSFKHAWNGYKRYGLPHDEVKPLSEGFADPFMGWGATLVDTLDTLWIMGMTKEFEEALLLVEKIDFKSSARKDIPLFETVIRYVGGLLGAYDVSEHKYPILLNKTEQLAEILLGAFDTPNRMPLTFYNWAPSDTSRPRRASAHAVMAELGSLSIEMTRLAQITKRDVYYDAVARITNELEKWQPKTLMPGLWPLKVDASGCGKAARRGKNGENGEGKVDNSKTEEFDINGEEPAIKPKEFTSDQEERHSGHIAERSVPPPSVLMEKERDTLLPKEQNQEVLAVACTPQGLSAEANFKSQIYGIGGQADSTYEYLPKMHALLQGRSRQFEAMYKNALHTVRDQLLFRPMIKDTNREILFAARHEFKPKAKAKAKRHVVTYEVTHLSCFIGGMFGLGSRLFGIESDLELAKQLTDGCVWAYASTPTGVMAELAAIVPCPDLDVCAWNETRWHEALDPDKEERFAAVEAWNKNQEAIYDRARKEVNDDSEGEIDRETGELADEKEPLQFVPKVALSHEKHVKARIQEERLPPSYTKFEARHYGLRPEAIESVFYMYRLTGDETWRQKGWKMFQAVQGATQTVVANAAMEDVTSQIGELDDSMESFWLAETLKYFYLLFEEPTAWSLDEWTLNTEAHLMKIPEG